MSYTIRQIAGLLEASFVGDESLLVDWLLVDSRSLCFPEQTLFFALKTERGDGHRYIRTLYAKGVRAFVVSELPEDVASEPDVAIIIVKDTRKALQKLAEMHRRQFEIPIVGVTGSNGKTVVKEWLCKLLSERYRITRSPRSYNSQIGVPLSVWMLGEDTELGIFEAGISEMGEMEPLQAVIRPSIGVLTNIGEAHQENFYSLQEKCLEKLRLFKSCDVIVYRGDDALLRDCVEKSMLTAKEIAWSTKDSEKPLYISSIQKGDEETVVCYRYLDFQGEYRIPYIDDASIENSINCLAVCLYLMMTPDEISLRMPLLEPVAMRLEVKEGKRGCTIINDSYNSDLASLDIALDFMGRRPERKGRRRTLILSDILETGQASRLLYRKVAQLVVNRQIDKFIGVGKDISASADFFSMESHFFSSTESLLASDVFVSLKDEVVLLKGARRFRFDMLSEQLELKVHETVLEIDLNALIANFNFYRKQIRPATKIVCMVKASAYGAGAYEVAKTLQDHQVDYLAVAVADEGVELRKAGITCPIIIMNPELTAFKSMFDYHLEPEVYSFHLLEKLIKVAEKEGIVNFPVHVKIDTGMHRLGFLPEDVPSLVALLKSQSSVVPRSVFSHLAGSDSPDFDSFTRQQIKKFELAADCLQAGFSYRILRHICNSAAIERFPEAQFDMVRLGLGLYGISPIDNSIIHHVATLNTTILQIHDVQSGETVGYSRRGVIDRTSRIAVLPIGYADGLNRRLGNGQAYCLVNGKPARYVGNICMDVCMIDVTDIECAVGDQAVIFGQDLPVTVLSDNLGTIPYEILTGIGSRVKRVYFQA